MQRVDDVTGDPIRLSARQREEQREMLVTVTGALVQHVDQLKREVAELKTVATAHEQRLCGLEGALMAIVTRRPWWKRVFGQ